MAVVANLGPSGQPAERKGEVGESNISCRLLSLLSECRLEWHTAHDIVGRKELTRATRLLPVLLNCCTCSGACCRRASDNPQPGVSHLDSNCVDVLLYFVGRAKRPHIPPRIMDPIDLDQINAFLESDSELREVILFSRAFK